MRLLMKSSDVSCFQLGLFTNFMTVSIAKQKYFDRLITKNILHTFKIVVKIRCKFSAHKSIDLVPFKLLVDLTK